MKLHCFWRVLFVALITCSFGAPQIVAQQFDAADCTLESLSLRAKRRIADWLRVKRDQDLRRSTREAIQKALTDPSYNCRDHQTFYALGVVLDAESLDPSVAIPALELLLPTTRYNENGERERHLVRLMIHYQYTASFNKLQELGQRELTDVPADLANYVRRAIAISFIGLGKEAEALSTLDEYISSGQGGVTRTDFHLAILLSERLNDDEKLHYFRELSNDHYQDLRWPSRLAGMSSDQFEIVFERLTNGTYLPRETELPRVTYPVAAERRSLNGKCDVFFDTDIEGRPINIEADCTDHIFVRSAERALAAARFEPLDFDGKRYPWIGIEYPIVYQISK